MPLQAPRHLLHTPGPPNRAPRPHVAATARTAVPLLVLWFSTLGQLLVLSLVLLDGGAQRPFEGTEFYLSTALLTMALAAHMAIGAVRGQLALFWPGFLFPLAYSFFHFATLPAADRVDWYDAELAALAWVIACLGLSTWMCGYSMLRGPARVVGRPRWTVGGRLLGAAELRRIGRMGQAAFYVGVLAQLAFLLNYGIVAYFTRTYGKEALEASEDNRLAYVYGIGLMCCTAGAIVAVLASLAERRRVLPNVTFAVVFGLYLLSLFLEGDRGGLTLSAIPALVMFHYWYRRISWRVGGIMVVGALLLFAGLKAYRYSKDFNTLRTAAVESDASIAMFREMGKTLDVMVRAMTIVPDKEEYFLGATYVSALARTLPNITLSRRRWGFVSSQWVAARTAPEVQRRHGGFGFTIIGEAYINFGPIGGVFVLFLFGLLHGRVERALTGPTLRFWAVAAFFVLEVSLLYHVRNSAVHYIRGFLWTGTIVAAIYLVSTWRVPQRSPRGAGPAARSF